MNMVDMSRRSLSYEQRLSKYAHRGMIDYSSITTIDMCGCADIGFAVGIPGLELSRISNMCDDPSAKCICRLIPPLQALSTPLSEDPFLESDVQRSVDQLQQSLTISHMFPKK
jgi:hypothetical protein